MSAGIFLSAFLLVTSIVATHSARAANPDPFKLLLYNLLDLDQSELFEPQQHVRWLNSMLGQTSTLHCETRREPTRPTTGATSNLSS